MKVTGAEILIESLKREGVKHIFGYPGGVVLNIFDVLFDEKDIEISTMSGVSKKATTRNP